MTKSPFKLRKDFYYDKAQLESGTTAAVSVLRESKTCKKNKPSVRRRCPESVSAHKRAQQETLRRDSHRPSSLHSSGVKTRALSSDTHDGDKTALV